MGIYFRQPQLTFEASVCLEEQSNGFGLAVAFGGQTRLFSGSPRLWAWFTHREVVGSYAFANNSRFAKDQFGPQACVHLLSGDSPKYVIVDSTYQGALLVLPRLKYLYWNYAAGTTFTANSPSCNVVLETILSPTSILNNGDCYPLSGGDLRGKT